MSTALDSFKGQNHYMSKTLINFLDKSLIASAFVIFVKFSSMFLLSKFIGIDWKLNEINGIFHPVSSVSDVQPMIELSSYSDLIVVLSMLFMLGFQVIRAFNFHNTHISPDKLLSLSRRNLLFLIKDSYTIYHSSAVWIYFSFVVNLVVLLNVFTGITYYWVGILSVMGTLLMVALIIKDISIEIENIRKHPSKYKWY